MKEYVLPQKTLLLWKLRAFIGLLLLFGVCALLSFTSAAFLLAAAVIIFIFCLFVFWYLPRIFKSCKINLVNDAVIVERGVFIKNTHILPFSRLIYTQSFTTPLAKIFGVTALSLKAARSRIFIPEISNSDAVSLLVELTRGDGE